MYCLKVSVRTFLKKEKGEKTGQSEFSKTKHIECKYTNFAFSFLLKLLNEFIRYLFYIRFRKQCCVYAWKYAKETILCFHHIGSLFGPFHNDLSHFTVQRKQKFLLHRSGTFPVSIWSDTIR